jgi:uncharacterized membrane protein YhfC
MRGNISIWVYVYTVLHALFLIGMGVAAYIDPTYQFTGLLQTSSVMQPIGLYANRNFAVALAALIAVVYGLRTRRPFQLTAIILIFLFLDISDIILLLFRSDTTLLMIGVYTILFWIPEILCLLYLHSKFRPYQRRTRSQDH